MKKHFIYLLLLLSFFQLKSQDLDSIRRDSTKRVENLVSELNSQLNAYPVIVNEDTLFTVLESPGFNSKSSYARFVERRIYKILERDIYWSDSLNVVDSSGFLIVKYGSHSLVEFSEVTTKKLGITNKGAADYAINHISDHFKKVQKETIIRKLAYLAIYIAIYILGLYILRFIYRRSKSWILSNDVFIDKFRRTFRIRKISEEDKDRTIGYILPILKYTYWTIIGIHTYIMLPIMLSVFYFTKDISERMLGYVLSPIFSYLDAMVEFIPNLIKIIILVLIFRLFLKLVNYIFNEIKEEGIKINGFYKEWAIPTRNIVKLVLYAFLFTIIFPLLPGSDSPIFKGMSVFIGLLISLGSTSVIANVLSGIIMTYMRPFKIGDRIEADGVTGLVVQKNLLITRIRTPKNVIVTVPNSKILSGHSKNFTTAAERSNLIVHGSITIGYDVDWRTVHKLLIDAAIKTNGIINQSGKEPFVLQSSLDDFYVAYEVNAYISQAEKFVTIQSDLFRNILDEFNKANVEIMSPHFQSNRDGESINIPEEIIAEAESETEKDKSEPKDINEKITARMEEIEKKKAEDDNSTGNSSNDESKDDKNN